MQRAALRIALTTCVLIGWMLTLPNIAPSLIQWWQGMSLGGRWTLVIFVVAVFLTRGTVRRIFRVADHGSIVLMSRSVSLPAAPARVGGVFGEASDRANYSPQVWERICRHEAAHVVTLVLQGGTLRSIRLKRDGLAAAGVFGGFDGKLSQQDRAWKHLVWSLAGYVVDDAEDVHDEGSTNDITNAFQYVATILSTGRRPADYQDELTMDQLIAGARAGAQRLLDDHGALLEALHTELVNSDRAVLRARDLPSLAPVIGRSNDSVVDVA